MVVRKWLVGFLMVPVLVASGLWVGPVRADTDEVIRRLRHDLNDVLEDNRQLRERIEELESLVQELQKRVQKLEESVTSTGEVETAVDEPAGVETDIHSETDSTSPTLDTDEVHAPDTPVEGDTPTPEGIVDELSKERGELPEFEWESSADRGYPVLEEPLQVKVNKTITEDDSLGRLAHKFYREYAYWEPLFEYNSHILKDPDTLPAGQILELPPITELDFILEH